MATNLTVRINDTDADIAYGESGAGYIDLDLINDYLIWTAGSDDVQAGEDEPTSEELNSASSLIDDSVEVQVAHCLLFDYSADILEEVEGMGANKKFVFCFGFDGDTASEPQLEAWDDSNHDSTDKHVLGGGGTPYDSFVKGVCTTLALPGTGWSGSAIAGSSDVLLLNNGTGALDALATGETSQELYANLKISIPQSYPTPSVETFVLTIRYTFN